MIRRIGLKRTALLIAAPSYLALWFDSYVGHELSGGGISKTPQYLPLVFAPLAFVVLLALAVRRISARALGFGTALIGGASVLMGLGGVVFHLIPIVEDAAKDTVTIGAVKGALGSGPPLLAPAAFFALGALVWFVGSRRVQIAVDGFSEQAQDATSAASSPVARSSDRAA